MLNFYAEFGMNKVNVFDLIKVQAMVIPLLLIGIRYITYGQDVQKLKLDLIGVAVGLILKVKSYLSLKRVDPNKNDHFQMQIKFHPIRT